jgi:hypothetical protein
VSADFIAPSSAGGDSGPLDTSSEDWFLEMIELDGINGDADSTVVMCQAYSLEYRATSAHTLRFQKMELRINRPDRNSLTTTTTDHLPRPYRGYTARTRGRIDVDPSVLLFGYGVLALDQQADYEGTFNFVKIYA